MENIKKMSWNEARQYLINFNYQHDIRSKGAGKACCIMVAVIKQESFAAPYTEEERSYRFSNHNKGFITPNLGNSIFADCLDGTDPCVRIDRYIDDGVWDVDYCYIKSEGEEV